MQLSQEQKTPSEFFSAFWQSSSNFEHIQQQQKKNTLMANVFPQLQDLQKRR